MLVKSMKFLIVVMSLFVLAGCVGMQHKIDMDPKFWSNKDQVIGVAVAKLPTPKTMKTGSQGLIDILINDANASDLDKHLATIDLSSIEAMSDKIVSYLNGKNISAKKIDDPIDIEALKELAEIDSSQTAGGKIFADRDYRALKDQYQVDKLLLITVKHIGTMRSYYGFIPTSAPVGSSQVTGTIINLSDNQLEWSQSATQNVPNPESEWDVPPNFPGLTKATMSAYEQSQQMLLNTFMQ